MKITSKTTKDTLVNVLRANYKKVEAQDKDLAERVAYTGKKADTATRKDLVDLVKEVITLLGDNFTEPAEKTPTVAENSVKKPIKSSTPKDKGEKKPASKTNATKKGAKKSEKSEGATDLNEKAVQLAVSFPESLEIDGEKYVIDHSVKKITDLIDGDFEFAFYWTERHLRQFPYFNDWLGHPKSFPNDLDTAQLIYVSDEGKVAYCVSDAMEVPYTILPSDLEEVDGIRFSGGIEFQIYRKVEEETSTDEPEESDDTEEAK